MAISIHVGTLLTGLFGPIPCGCRTISKLPVGVGAGGFGVGVVGTYVFAGYLGGYWL